MTELEWRELDRIVKLPQRQDSLNAQLGTLLHFANRLGCYDAADFIIQVITKPL